jgi:chemotaxis regulatin CheY-phosphate phosphatase CheZ
MEEIELNVLTGQCLKRRMDNIEIVRKEALAILNTGIERPFNQTVFMIPFLMER